MPQSEQLNELGTALAKAQGELSGAIKDAQNPFFKSHYADLESVWSAIRQPLSKHGLSVIQTTECINGNAVLSTLLLHSSGQWISGLYPIQPVKTDPQGLGSAITYARRYALAAIVGVYQTDDDAEAAMNRQKPQQAVQAPIKPTVQTVKQTINTAVKVKAGSRPPIITATEQEFLDSMS